MKPFSLPEPVCDIRAQIEYMLDGHKKAVFIASGNEDADPGEGPWLRHKRNEGVLITTSQESLERFKSADHPLTDEIMAALLDYPAPKWDAILAGDPIFAQILNREGNVVKEAVVSFINGSLGKFFETAVIPEEGRIVLESPITAQLRRARLRAA